MVPQDKETFPTKDRAVEWRRQEIHLCKLSAELRRISRGLQRGRLCENHLSSRGSGATPVTCPVLSSRLGDFILSSRFPILNLFPTVDCHPQALGVWAMPAGLLRWLVREHTPGLSFPSLKHYTCRGGISKAQGKNRSHP